MRHPCRAISTPTLRSAVTCCRRVGIGCLPLLLGACGGGEQLSFLNPQGPVAQAQMVHFYWVLGIMAVFVAGPIFLALPFFLWRYRYGNTAARYTPHWRDNNAIVLLTWAGPVLIVCALGFLVWRDSHRLDPYKPLASGQSPLQIQVIGYDWKWLIIYPKQNIATIGTLVMPIGRPLSIRLTSATVMQSFFIPALAGQIYAMGGMVTRLNLEANQAGRFLGENTMYDGDGFPDQKFVAVATSAAQFKDWIRTVQATGVPLDNALLQMISRRTTRAQLVASLPPAAVHAGNAYFTHVTPNLFARIAASMMRDGSPLVPIADVATTAAGAHPVPAREAP